jgi:hypothetical protein
MKGIGILAVLFVGAVASLGVGGLLTAATLYRVENMIFSVQDIYVISEINRFENVKIGLPVAASYSFYQALYDVSKVGGSMKPEKSLNGIAVWRYYSWAKFPEKYKDEIAEYAKKIFMEYIAASLYKGYVSYPTEYDASVEEYDDFAIINFTSKAGSLQYISKVLQLVLSQDPDAFARIDTLMKQIYALGKEKVIRRDVIVEAADAAYKELPMDCKHIEFVVCGYLPPADPEQILQQHCPNADSLFNKNFVKNINQLMETGVVNPDAIKILSNVKESKVMHEGFCQVEPISSDPPCWRIICDYYYYGAARVLVSITDKKNAYPVYDGFTDYRNVVLNFYAISGNKELLP